MAPVALGAPGDVQTGVAREIAPGAASSSPERLTVVGSTLFFTADHPSYGRELWKTTSDGVTKMVKNIDPGTMSSNPEELTAVGSTLFFTADDGTGDRELWKSDGTGPGTVRVRNINRVPNPDSNPNAASWPAELTEVNGRLFFAAQVGQQPDPISGLQPADDRELYVSDGTAAGTRRVANILSQGATHAAGSSNPSFLTSWGGGLYFRAVDQYGVRLWRSDGTRTGTVPVSAVPMAPEALTVVGNLLFFTGSRGSYNREPWVTDGTAAGTRMLRDLDTFPGSPSNPDELTAVGDRVFFSADVGGDRELYSSDGTTTGTRRVRNINLQRSSAPSELTAFHDELYFQATIDGNTELYRSDGTFAGTVLVKDIYNGGGSSPTELTVVGDHLFFHALTSFNTSESRPYDQLVRSDGTAAGTVPVGVAGPAGDGVPSGLGSFNGTLYYRDSSPGAGVELWKATIEP
ncbi:hypothetical protein [Nocardioides sp. MH1]|uniref:hypothetical protein n=1 Tax=Nocardioides sp. MH1 TaxID=3242490 RepID=UPI003522069C